MNQPGDDKELSLVPFVAGAVTGAVVSCAVAWLLWTQVIDVSDNTLARISLGSLIFSTFFGMAAYANRSWTRTQITNANSLWRTFRSRPGIATILLGVSFGQGLASYFLRKERTQSPIRDSQWWPEDAGDLGAYATTLASLVTFFLFVISFHQLRLLRDQVRLASEETRAALTSANAAQVSAEAAIEAASEAARTRVDAYSPRLIVTVELQPGARADPSRSAVPNGNETRLLDPRSFDLSRPVAEGQEFIFDQDRHVFIWFRVTGSVLNEGNGSGKVRLDDGARFEHAEYGEEIVLRPGAERRFEWAAGFPAFELADRRNEPRPAQATLSITGNSYEDKGVIDKIYLELASRCLREAPGHQGAFVFRDNREDERLSLPATVATVYPTQRIYRWDWDAGKIPATPWNQS